MLADGDYDIGFAFDDRGTTGGGCASGPVVCDDDNKAEGMAAFIEKREGKWKGR